MPEPNLAAIDERTRRVEHDIAELKAELRAADEFFTTWRHDKYSIEVMALMGMGHNLETKFVALKAQCDASATAVSVVHNRFDKFIMDYRVEREGLAGDRRRSDNVRSWVGKVATAVIVFLLTGFVGWLVFQLLNLHTTVPAR